MIRKILIAGLGTLTASVAAVAVFVTVFTNHVYVTTPSMFPTIPPGSLAVIEKARSYHVGDVIEFHGNGLVFMHRIIGIGRNGDITTKGDNPENAPDVFDPATTSADVIGKVVYHLEWAGFPELIAHHPGYGLAWLRAELGLVGRLLVLAISVIIFFAAPIAHRYNMRHGPRAEAWLGETIG